MMSQPLLKPHNPSPSQRMMMLLLLEKNSNKCKPKWMPLLPKLIKRELSNKPNTKTISIKETQLLNSKDL